MKRVTGIGGIFFKAKEPDKLREWYRAHLGIEAEKEGGATFKWRDVDVPSRESYTVWSPFAADTDYFAPSKKPFMINFQVENLEELLAQLKREGIDVAGPASGGQLLQEQGSTRYSSISRRSWATQLIGTIGCPLGAKQVDPKVETYDYGKFGWIMDLEGNRIELWEPAKEK